MEKFIIVTCLMISVLTVLLGVSALKSINDGRIQTVVKQLVK